MDIFSEKVLNGLSGEIEIPSDKSISHRAVMFSALAKGECVISNFSRGADCHSTLNIIKQLGSEVEFIDDKKHFDVTKADLLAYAHGNYMSLGKTIGTFGYSVKKK